MTVQINVCLVQFLSLLAHSWRLWGLSLFLQAPLAFWFTLPPASDVLIGMAMSRHQCEAKQHSPL